MIRYSQSRSQFTQAAAFLVGSLVVVSFSSAFAQGRGPADAGQEYMALVQTPVAGNGGRFCDPANKFHCSGTRGRLGQGADALFPEGPGNVSN